MAWEEIWEEVFQSNRWGEYPSEDVVRFVARNFYKSAQRSDIALLELGCGPGANLWFCAREGFSVYGIDGSETAARLCRGRLDRECAGWRGEVFVGDFSRGVPLGDATIDAVIDCEAVSCNDFESSLRAYAEAWRVLKPGGLLFVQTFSDACSDSKTGQVLDDLRSLPATGPLAGRGSMRFTQESDLPKLLAGFDVQELSEVQRTRGHGKASYTVAEWIVTARKAP